MRGRLRTALILACAGIVIWAVAPALSLERWRPEARDFEQAIGKQERVHLRVGAAMARAADEHGDGEEHEDTGEHLDETGTLHGPVRFVTGAIEAPRRFDLVGVVGTRKPLEISVREDSGWSEWIPVSGGEPVYTGGADRVRLRSRGPRIEGKLHYVNVSGNDTPLRGILTGVRSAVNSAFVSTLAPANASARPGMVSREQWGANRGPGGCRPTARRSLGKVKAAAVHHTVTTNLYSASEAPGIVLAICRFHRNGNGWNDIGYNALVDRFGRIYVGRAGGIGRPVIGAHAQGYNSNSTGVALIGNHTDRADRPRKAALRALVKYLAWKLDRHGMARARGKRRIVSEGGGANRYPAGRLVRLHRIFPHGEANYTTCAGEGTARTLRRVRRAVQRRLNRHNGGAPPSGTEEPTAPDPEEPPEDPVPKPSGNGGVQPR